MDTIHTLNTSLPSSTTEATQTPSSHSRNFSCPNPSLQIPARSRTSTRATSPSASTNNPPTSLHAAFKAAAFSVTQLYKAAAADGESARAAGYQDAIDDLLAFLDAENLGLGDGEGWRVRQWATQRLEPSMYGVDMTQGVETPNKQGEKERAAATTNEDQSGQDTTKISTHHHDQPDTSTSHIDTDIDTIKDSDMANEADQPTSTIPETYVPSVKNTDPPFIFSSPSVLPQAHFSHQSKTMPLPISIGSLGHGAGTKRKPPPNINDYFDFGPLHNSSANGWQSPRGLFGSPGGGKRSRMD